MTLKRSTLVWTFIWSLFMGITAIAIGFGAAFPPLNLIAGPFVCPSGQMQLTTQDYRPSPVETVTTLTWYCVDNGTGKKVELDIFPMVLYSGLIYGLLLFFAIFIGMVILAKRRALKLGAQDSWHDPELDELVALEQSKKVRKSIDANAANLADLGSKFKAATNAAARMAELKKNARCGFDQRGGIQKQARGNFERAIEEWVSRPIYRELLPQMFPVQDISLMKP